VQCVAAANGASNCWDLVRVLEIAGWGKQLHRSPVGTHLLTGCMSGLSARMGSKGTDELSA
jgi:hypothetical protein